MSRNLVLPILIALSVALLGSPVLEARDPTIGLCTREDEFNKAFEQTDAGVVELTSAGTEEEKAEIGAKIAEEHGQGISIECLIRYREKDMVHVFLPLLKAESWAIRQRALYALKMVGDEGVVEAVGACLVDDDARIREMAANCLCHLAKEVPEALREALGKETDRFAKSSMKEAVSVIESGAKPYEPWTETLVGPEGAKRVERAWVVKGKPSFNRFDAKSTDTPRTALFDWPISWYEGSLFCETPRKSFGANGKHCGEDMAWFREGASIFAMADGHVRMIQGAGGNWGFLLTVEHRLSTGIYLMAVYGHCGFDILVKPGDKVKKGQKLGTVGLSCSIENGGYGAHLHFGISQGPFRRPKRIRRGVRINLKFGDKNVPTLVQALVYHPNLKDQHGFPRVGLVVRFPDGKMKVVPGPDEPMKDQLSWCTGYVKNCVGWLDPAKFIRELRKREKKASPVKLAGDGEAKPEGGEPEEKPEEKEPEKKKPKGEEGF